MAEYNLSLPGFDEARFYAHQTIIQGGIADLNTHLAISPSIGSFRFKDTDIKVGDAEYIDRTRISIIGGGEASGLDQEISGAFVGRGAGVGFANKLHTAILCYLWDEDFNEFTNPFDNGFAKEIFMARVADFFDKNLYNTKTRGTIILSSQYYKPAGDPFYNEGIVEITKAPTLKGVGKMQEIMTVTMMHRMEIR